MNKRSYLDGQMLIAMPGMSDPRFDHSLIYLCAHSENGAMGLIVNKVTPMMSFGDLVGQLDAVDMEDLQKTNEELMTRPVLFGGPVEPGRGFVLHTRAPGQLEDEIQHNGWLHCDADEDLLFGTAHDLKYVTALRKIGVDPGMLSGDAGHA